MKTLLSISLQKHISQPRTKKSRQIMKVISHEGRRLEQIQHEMGITQNEMARALGVHPVSFSRYVRGVRKVPTPTLRLAEKLREESRSKNGKPHIHHFKYFANTPLGRPRKLDNPKG